jgi:hypothetical protein
LSTKTSRHTWIKGHDLAALALAATEQLDASTDACEYLLFSPNAPHPSGMLLEVVQNFLSRREKKKVCRMNAPCMQQLRGGFENRGQAAEPMSSRALF